jgi:Fe2+ transport system protein FeoA
MGVVAVNDLLPLRFLTPGQSAQIGQIMGDPDEVHRLNELGLCNGSTVEMVQSGSPCIIRMSGHKLCFRQNEALNVLVRTVAV